MKKGLTGAVRSRSDFARYTGNLGESVTWWARRRSTRFGWPRSYAVHTASGRWEATPEVVAGNGWQRRYDVKKGGKGGRMVTLDTQIGGRVPGLSERTMSVPACLREAPFGAVCCSTETEHLQADSPGCTLLEPLRQDL